MIRLIDAVEAFLLRLGIFSGFATLLITLVVVFDVTGRAAFNSPFHSGVEISELLMITLVFFGLAAAQQQRQNYAIDVVSRHLPLPVQSTLELLGYLFCLGVVVMLAWPATKQALVSFERGESGFGIVPFPLWPARSILAMGLWLLAVQFVCDILRHVLGTPRVSASDVDVKAAGLE
jgi:TRAP-type C4-dicarboxylate transport system permease small subunit